jgi:hypothetical protein
MKNLLALIRLLVAFSEMKGAKFVSIRNYHADNGEVANHVVNMNISVMNAKKGDNSTLHSVTDTKLSEIAKGREIALDVFNMALSQLVASSDKNLAPKVEDRNRRSQATTNSYIHLSPSIKILKEDTKDGKGFRGDIHLFGLAVSKVVIEEGEYKQVKSADKTIAKRIITKELALRSGKFRTYKFRRMGNVVINKQIIDGQEANVLTIEG